jgi:hypothetical protein
MPTRTSKSSINTPRTMPWRQVSPAEPAPGAGVWLRRPAEEDSEADDIRKARRESTMTDDIEKTLEDIEALFAQTAREVTSEGDKVTLHGASPATLYFSDRPQRVVGHLTTKKFVEEWGLGENSFADDPPNAVISFVEKGDATPEDAIVVLKDPQLEGDKLTYTVDTLEGSLPAKGELVSVFIDPFGRPLSPVSLAGMNRRARRRGR